MVVLSEISDGSKGDDPNEKPQELEKKPQEPKDMFESLTVTLTELCIARAAKFDYPAISMTSTAFRRLIASPQLYHTRSKLAVSEHFLYDMIRVPPCQFPQWHLLSRTSSSNEDNTSLQLRLISTLPLMPLGSTVVTIGPEIYIIGGRYGNNTNTSDLLRIDCRTHTCDRSLPRMKVARFCAAAGVINGMIYVMGGCEMPSSKWVEVFDPKIRTWLGWTMSWLIMPNVTIYALMDEMLYIYHGRGCSAYDSKLGHWLTWVGGNQVSGLWRECCCVVDDMLYSIDPSCSTLGHPIVVYDPKEETWRHVKGVDALPRICLCYFWSKMANLGGKLVILASKQSWRWNSEEKKEIWCIEIGLEKRQGGEIWGKLESANVVLKNMDSSPYVELCRTVTV